VAGEDGSKAYTVDGCDVDAVRKVKMGGTHTGQGFV
jgi:hypothetical protein